MLLLSHALPLLHYQSSAALCNLWNGVSTELMTQEVPGNTKPKVTRLSNTTEGKLLLQIFFLPLNCYWNFRMTLKFGASFLSLYLPFGWNGDPETAKTHPTLVSRGREDERKQASQLKLVHCTLWIMALEPALAELRSIPCTVTQISHTRWHI